MTNEQFRSLCAELQTALAERIDDKATPSPYYVNAAALIARARAALAAPQQGAFTDDELLKTYCDAVRACNYEGPAENWSKAAARAYTLAGLRAVVARYGTPAPVPVAEPPTDRVLLLAAIIREVDGGNRLGAAALAEAILSHRAITGVLPLPEVP